MTHVLVCPWQCGERIPDKFWQVAWAPIEQEATKQIDFRGRSEKQKVA